VAVGSARPDLGARNVTYSDVRALLGFPSHSDEWADRLLTEMYSVADVVVQAFIERPTCTSATTTAGNAPEVALSKQMLAPSLIA
jgi:hypothetical protein